MPPDPAFRPKARKPRGFPDRRGPGLARERALIANISAVYEAWGFEPLETGAFEFAEALGKFLPDQDRPNEGVFALQDDDEQWVSLRYDLTAPLARFVAEHFDALPKPYRRWAAGPVWRNEKPGPGRFREFWQCDADTVGAPGAEADAEMIAMACAALEAVGLGEASLVKISTRKLLDGLLNDVGVPESEPAKRAAVFRAIDKYDRLGLEGVQLLLRAGRKDESGDFTRGAELSEEQARAVEGLFIRGPSPHQAAGRDAAIEQLRRQLRKTEEIATALDELAAIDRTLTALGVGQDRAAIDPHIVRGLDYYTGAVFEAQIISGDGASLGSIGGGGRYDDLVARFRGERIPATGFSIGVSRLAAALEARDADNAISSGPIVILPFDKAGMGECFVFAQRLRAAGLRAEVYLGGAGPKAQLRYADKRSAPIAVILGGDERAAQTVTLKDLQLGAALAKTTADNKTWREAQPAQETVPQSELEACVRAILQRQNT